MTDDRQSNEPAPQASAAEVRPPSDVSVTDRSVALRDPPAAVASVTAPASRVTVVTVPTTSDTGTTFVDDPAGEPLPSLPAAVCSSGTAAIDLEQFFDGRAPLLGADYQRAYPLPDGRVLWLFQDAFLATGDGPQLVHNVGLLQSGTCFQLLRNGTTRHPLSYLLPELTERFVRWFWPLGGEIGADGLLHVFVAEMREHSSGYLVSTEPAATWLVSIDPTTLDVLAARPARDASSSLYGWSVVSDAEFTYLFAHCYRQFGWDPLWFAPDVLAHDFDCAADVSVARVPKGVLTATPAYWNGTAWVDDASAAVAVIPVDGRPVNPTQVVAWDGRFVAVTKVGDWWGHEIVLDVADVVTGPWETYATVHVDPECTGCATYFASIVPYGADATSFVVGLSCNLWSGELSVHYTPTFLRVPAPS